MRVFLSTVSAGLLLAIGLLGLSHWQGPTASDRSAAAQDDGPQVTLEAGDLFFMPENLTLAEGATLILTNTGVLPHNFVVEGYNDDAPVEIPRDIETEWTVPADLPPGEYTFYCAIPGHRQSGMHGTLTIAAAGDEAEEQSASPSPDDAGSSATADELRDRVDDLEQQVNAQAADRRSRGASRRVGESGRGIVPAHPSWLCAASLPESKTARYASEQLTMCGFCPKRRHSARLCLAGTGLAGRSSEQCTGTGLAGLTAQRPEISSFAGAPEPLADGVRPR